MMIFIHVRLMIQFHDSILKLTLYNLVIIVMFVIIVTIIIYIYIYIYSLLK